MTAAADTVDILILGGGPAGAGCALWLKKLGFEPLLVDRRTRLGGLQNESPYPNDWLAGVVGLTGQDFASAMDGQLRKAGVRVEAGWQALEVESLNGGFRIGLQRESKRRVVKTRLLVAATGARAKDAGLSGHPNIIVGPGRAVEDGGLRGRRVAILGGGDNAFENHGIITEGGAASVTIFARSVRARRALAARVPESDLRVGPYEVDPQTLTVAGERFERLVVLYGWQANSELFSALNPALDSNGYIRTRRDTAESSVPGLYAIGELAHRQHPCCATALADGVVAARAIQDRLEGVAAPAAARYASL